MSFYSTNGLLHMSKTLPIILKTIIEIFCSISTSPHSFNNMSQVVNEKIVSDDKFDFSDGIVFSC